MKHLIVLAICLFGSVSANYLHADVHAAPAIVAPVAAINTGSSTQYRSQDNIGNYVFGYNEAHSTGGTYRRESGDSHGNKVGSYGLRDIDGRVRVVSYVADGLGFRASIASNEPGTAAQPAADTSISSPYVIAAAPAHYAPVLHAAPAVEHHAIAHPGIGHPGLGHPGLGHHGIGHPSIAEHAPIHHGITGHLPAVPSHLSYGHHGHPGLLAAPDHYGAHYGDIHAPAFHPIRR